MLALNFKKTKNALQRINLNITTRGADGEGVATISRRACMT